jgi:uncharacterized protein (DUF433 family)
MKERPIVRDPDILSGRWRIDGTQITVAAIREDRELGIPEIRRHYRGAYLTEAEIRAALNFEFPPVREPGVDIYLSSVTVRCECGEDTPLATTGPDMRIECVCGRQWRVSLSVNRSPAPSDVQRDDQPEHD